MSELSEILDVKGGDVLRIEAEASVFEAVRRMVEANVGSLLVLEDGKVAGIVTERDYLRRVTLEDRDERTTPVREIMTSELMYVGPDASVEECMAVMTERRIRHLPVLADEQTILGVVSIGDLVKFQSSEQSVQIKFLTEYISG
jgi:IMP dehydrogenase